MPDNNALIILTRPEAQARRFAELTEPLAETLIAPLQEIVFAAEHPEVAPGTLLLFTSENGVRAAQEMGVITGEALCVGDRTAQAARDLGFETQSAQGVVEDLIRLARTRTGPMLHIHGKHQRGDLVGELRAAGQEASGLIGYEQTPLPLNREAREAIASPRHCLLPVFSPLSAKLLAETIPTPQNCQLACISEATHQALPPGLRQIAEIAEKPNGNAVLKLLEQQLCP